MRHVARRGPPFVLAAALAFSTTLHFVPASLRLSPVRWGSVAAVVALLLVVPLRRWVLDRLGAWLRSLSRASRRNWLLGAFTSALLLVMATPIQPPRIPRGLLLEVTALGTRGEASRGTEVWVHGLVGRDDEIPLPLTPLPVAGQWEDRDGALVSSGHPPATLRWEGVLDREAVLRLGRHPWSGLARISLNGESQTVDLSSESSGGGGLRLDVIPASPGWLFQTVALLSDVLCLGLLVLAAGALLVSWPGPASAREPRPWDWLLPGVLCASIWSIYLLAFWPGLMTVDSVDQWSQMVHGTYSNVHPVFHTLTNWLVTRVWHSPAAVALVQLLLMAGVFSLAVRELGLWGVPRGLLWGVTLLFALSPINGVMVITLWKDIPYAIANLALFTLLLRVARTRGEALRSGVLLVTLGGVLTVLALLRHNGTMVAVLVVALLFILCPRALRRRMLGVALGTAAAFVLITGPIYKAVGAKPMSRGFALALPIFHVGAIVHAAPESVTPAERRVLESIQAWEIWRDAYSCFSINPQLNNGRIRMEFFESPENRWDFLRLWSRLALKHWDVLLSHQTCVSSLVWRVLPLRGGYTYLFDLNIQPNAFGLEGASKWPKVQEFLRGGLIATAQPERSWWMWRPALYLYVCLFFAVIAALRQRSAWVLLSVLPVLVNSLVLLGINIAQDFRYQYPVYVVALLSPALLCVRRGPQAQVEATPSSSASDEREPDRERQVMGA
ncbi:MAG TPA: DUF6020 family protein [Archangium sp.]|nr:DUF6020 family protein [Archangium sp.]